MITQDLVHTSRTGLRMVSTNTLSIKAIPLFLAPSIASSSYRPILASRAQPFVLTQRNASSSTRRATATQSTSNQALVDRINPAATTRPAILETPTRRPDQSAPSYYFALGKSYVSFYKSGLKAIWNNRKAAKAIRETHLQGGRLNADKGLTTGVITRAEWQLLRRAAADLRKLPLFGLVLAICGEFTPLVVIALRGVVPRTCLIPHQIQKERESLEARRRASFEQGDSIFDVKELDAGTKLRGEQDVAVQVNALRWEQVLHISRSLGLYSRLWDTLWDYPPQWLLKRRVQRALEYIRLDDDAIKQFGGVARLDTEELKLSSQERGLDVLGRSDTRLRDMLEKWLKAQKNQSVPFLILTRPSVWKV